MITEESIKTLAKKYQTTEQNVRREYLQHLFLRYLYKQKGADRIYFKGGTALRIIYHSPRFSEDLDFSTSLKSVSFLEKIIIGTLSEIEREGIETEIKEAKKTSGGYLAEVAFALNGVAVNILLEISLRNIGKAGQTVVVAGDFVPSYVIEQLQEQQLIDEKMQALFSRRKPRDFFDLYFILRANLLSVSQRKMLVKVEDALNKTQINFTKELKEFLPKSHWLIIKDFTSVLRRELRKF